MHPRCMRFSYECINVRIHSPPSPSLSVCAFVLPCWGPAAFTAVRYARLADEKNKRRRNVERQKEQIDIEWEGRRGEEDWKEGERKTQKEREMQRMQVAIEEEGKRKNRRTSKLQKSERERIRTKVAWLGRPGL